MSQKNINEAGGEEDTAQLDAKGFWFLSLVWKN